MSDEYLETLEANAYAAIHTLEKERYYDFSELLAELVRQTKHYQRITESILAGQAGLPFKINQAEFNRANNERDWFRHPEPSVRPAAEIE